MSHGFGINGTFSRGLPAELGSNLELTRHVARLDPDRLDVDGALDFFDDIDFDRSWQPILKRETRAETAMIVGKT